MTPNKRFGQLLSEGIVSVARRQRKQVAAVEQEIAEALRYSHHTIQRWRRGYPPREPEQVAFLARYSVTHGRVGRDWAQSLLTQARYPHRDALLQELFPERPPRAEVPRVYQNLPPHYGDFLGREVEMARVLEGLASRWPMISIEGLGGVGKTTLAIEIACCCLPGPEAALDLAFEAVVWVSAKDRPEQKQWLNDVLDITARVLDYPYITQLPMEEKPVEVSQLLRAQRTLVIVDNFETIEDPDLVAWMQRIPEPSKVLITSRRAQLRSVWAIHLGGLEEPEALELIHRHIRRLGLRTLEDADEDALLPLARVTEGNPKAIEMALGHVKYGALSLSEVVDCLHAASKTVSGLFDDLFARAWETLTEDARHLLLVVPFSVDAASKEALGAAAGLTGYRLDAALGQLVETSLVDASEEVGVQSRYNAHPLTRAFAGARLHEESEWEREARERWLEYLLEFAQTYAGEDWDDWRRYEVVTPELPTLLSACRWAFDMNRTKLALDLLDKLEGFLFIRGMWEERVHISRKAIFAARKIGDASTLGRWLSSCAWPLIWKGEFAEAHALLSEAVELLERRGKLKELRRTLHHLGVLYYRQGNYQEAVATLERSLAFALQQGNDRGVVEDSYYLGCVAFAQGNFNQAIEWFNEVKVRGHDIKWARAYAYARNWLADIARIQGDHAQARQLLEEGFPIIREFKDQRRIAYFQLSYALLEEAEDHLKEALDCARQAHDLFHRLGMRQEEAETMELIERLEGVPAREGGSRWLNQSASSESCSPRA